MHSGKLGSRGIMKMTDDYNKHVSFKKRLVVWLVVVTHCFQPIAVMADVIADPSVVSHNQPTIDATQNGTPLVYITTPSAGGVSRNLYSEFSINSQGVLLNNNNQLSPVSSSQGQIIQQNPNLIGSQAAQIILNEVTSTRRSLLNGSIEVVGSQATVVIANPNGITCNGCGFINTSRGVLTTGVPVFGGQGSLDAFRVTQGDILIGENGLNGSDIQQIDVLTRALQVRGPIWAKKLNAIVGSNDIDFTHLTLTEISNDTGSPSIGIDIATLGGMYAGKIHLISNEAGVGVNNQGEIGSSIDDVVIDSSGRVSFGGKLSAATDVTVNAAEDINVSGSVFAQGNIAFNTAADIDVSGRVEADKRIDVIANNITISDQGELFSKESSAVSVDSVLINEGSIGALVDVMVSAQQVVQNGKITAGGDLQLDSGVLTNRGSVHGNNTDLNVVGDLINDGDISSVQQLNVTSGLLRNEQNGLLLSTDGDVLISSSGDIVNVGNIESRAGSLSLFAEGSITNVATYQSNGAFNESFGNLVANDTLSIIGQSTVINRATIFSSGNVAIQSNGDVINSNLIIGSDGLSVVADRVVNEKNNVEKDGALVSTEGDVSVQAETLIENQGTIFSDRDIHLSIASTGTIINRLGANLESEGDIALGLSCIKGSDGSCANDQSGDMGILGNVTVTNEGSINSLADIYVVAHQFTNNIVPIPINSATLIAPVRQQYLGFTGRYDDLISDADYRSGGYHVPFRYGSYYRDWERRWVTRESFGSNPFSPRIVAEQNMVVRTNLGENRGGTIAVGGSLQLASLTGGGSFVNESAKIYEYRYLQTGRDQYYCGPLDGACLFRNNLDFEGERNVALVSERVLYDSRGGVIQVANDAFSVSELHFVNNGDKAENLGVLFDGVDAKNVSQPDVDFALPDLPTGSNGLFVLSDAPDSNYLYISNPRYKRDPGEALSTDYLLSLMNVNEDDVIRLGDSLYEQRLLRDQILEVTGRAWITDAETTEEQFKLLMDSGFLIASNLGLQLGEPLTEEQQQGLDQDIVWLTTKVVNGIDALVPQLYLSNATKGTLASGQVLAETLIMDVASFSNNGGEIIVEQDATIISQGDAVNSAGLIVANNLAVVSTDGKVINESVIERFGDADNFKDVAYQGEMIANNALILSGEAGVDVLGASVSAANSLVLHSASGNIHVESLTLASKSTEKSQTLGFLSSSSETTVTTEQTLVGANISAGLAGNSDAQLTLLSENGDVNLAGANVNSSGNINIKAGNVNIRAVHLENSQHIDKKSSGISASDDGLFIGATSFSSQESSSTAQGSSLTAGNGLNVQADNSIVLEGGTYNANTGRFEAGNDVTFKAAENTYSYSENSASVGLSMGSGTTQDDDGNVTGHTASIGFGANANEQDVSTVNYTNVMMTMGDGLAIQAGNTVDIGGLTAVVTNVATDVATDADTSIPLDEGNGQVAEQQQSNTEAPSSLFADADPSTFVLDVAQLRESANAGDSGAVISRVAESGLGVVNAFGDMDTSQGVGSLSITADKITSTKFQNKHNASSQSESTYVGVSVSSDSDSVGASLSGSHNQSAESLKQKADNISSLAGANVTLSGKDSIALKGVAILGTENVSLVSEGDITILAGETEETYSQSSNSTNVGVGFETGVSTSPTNLTGPVQASVSLNISHESQEMSGQRMGHQDSVLSSEGSLNIVSDSGDITWVGVTADAADLAISAENFSSAAYEDSSSHSESNTAVGISLTVSTDLEKMVDDLLGGNGMSASTLDSNSTQEVGNTMVANNAIIQVTNNVTIVGGDVLVGTLGIKANTVDIVAAKSTLVEHTTETGISLTADGSASIAGYKAYGSVDSMTGKVDSGTSSNSGLADRTGHGKTNNGKAISDELVTAKVGLAISHRTEETNSTQYRNANVQFTHLVIDTLGDNASGDGHVDIGGANLLAFLDQNTESESELNVGSSSIDIMTGELKTTKYVDRTESRVHDNSTFVGYAVEAHSAVVDTVNHSKTLADKSNEGMEIDAGWTAAQGAADSSNLAMGDLAGASVSLTLRNMDTKTHTIATSENINYVNADHINITTTRGDITLSGVMFNAPPIYNETTGEMEKASGPRPQSISLDSANNVSVTAAKSTYEESSITLTNDVNATLAGSVSSTGAGVNADLGYSGSRSEDQLKRTTYTNASIDADNVSITSKNLSLTGANVQGDNVEIDVVNAITITSVQDIQTQSTTRSNYGGSIGAGIGTMGIVPSVNAQGGGGNSHDNSAITQQQSGILAENTLTVNAGGDVNLTGAHIAVKDGGIGSVNISGDVNATVLEDYRDKDGLFAGGGGGIDAAGVNVNVNFEKVDQVKYNATQNATIDVGAGVLNVTGEVGVGLNKDFENATNVTQDRKIAGVYANASGFVPGPKKRSKYDSNVVVITTKKDGTVDKTVEQSAIGLYNKHKDNTVVLRENPNSKTGFDVIAGDVKKVNGKTRMNVVGHGDDLGGSNGKGSEAVAALVKKAADITKLTDSETDSNLQRVGIVACGTCNKLGDKTLGEAVLRDLDKQGIKTEVGEYTGKISVNYQTGIKTAYLDKNKVANKRVLTLDKSKQLVVKEKQARRVKDKIDQKTLGYERINPQAPFASRSLKDVMNHLASSAGPSRKSLKRPAAVNLKFKLRPQKENHFSNKPVKLFSKIPVDDNGFVGDIVIVGRTPSPFGSTMGAHSTAWVAHVDKVRRFLMNTEKDEGFIYMKELADGELASPMLKYRSVLSSAHQIKLDRAEKNLKNWVKNYDQLVQTKSYENLTREQQAIRHKDMIDSYLSFVNLIPMSTVEGGKTTGNNEGASRNNINRYEYASAHLEPGADLQYYPELKSRRGFEKVLYAYFTDPKKKNETKFMKLLENDFLNLFAVDTPDQFVKDHSEHNLVARDVWSDSLSSFFDTIRLAYPSTYYALDYTNPKKLKGAVSLLLDRSPVKHSEADVKAIASQVIKNMSDGGSGLLKAPSIREDRSEVSSSDINGVQQFHVDFQFNSQGKIEVVEAGGRTESPFSKSMGAHSTAWVAHMDALKNALTNKTLKDAVNILRDKSGKALNDESLNFSGLLTTGHQHKLIQAHKKMEALIIAGDGGDSLGYLRNMIEDYANLVNLLPMSTNDIGNTDGKAEGYYRQLVLDIETGANNKVTEGDAMDALLGLYDVGSVENFDPDGSANWNELKDAGLKKGHPLYSAMLRDSDYVYTDKELGDIKEQMRAISIDRFINTIEEAYPRIYNAIGRDKLIEKLVALHRNGGESEYEGA